MKISKFGGSSVASARAIENIIKLAEDNNRKILVFSAIGASQKGDKKVTDLLLEAYDNFLANHNLDLSKVEEKFAGLKEMLGIKLDGKRELDEVKRKFLSALSRDYLVSRGEDLTARMFAEKLNLPYIPSETLLFFDGKEVDYNRTETAIKKQLALTERFVTGGFYGSDEKGQIKLLSRGGGDLSGAILAKVAKAKEYEIFTDVDGIYQINPILGKSSTLKTLSYADLNFMTSLDAKVVHSECGKVLKNTRTKIIVRNCFDLTAPGTEIAKGNKADKSYISFSPQTGDMFLTKLGKRRKISAYERENAINLL